MTQSSNKRIDSIRIKNITDEIFQDYREPSMFIATSFCNWKCCKEYGKDICQNWSLATDKVVTYSFEKLYERYINNGITKAIVLGGLEPMLQCKEVYNLITYFRDRGCDDTFVIYTGYYPNEITYEVNMLRRQKNIIVKFGRYIPNKESRYDDVLGVNLVSSNQFAEKIS